MTDVLSSDINVLLGDEPEPENSPILQHRSIQSPFRPIADVTRLWGAMATSAEQLLNNPRRMAMDILRLFLANRTPLTLWGPVGARKTRTIEGLITEKDMNGVNYQVITMSPSTQDPTIIHGIMYTAMENDQMIMKRSIPDVAKQVIDYNNSTGGYTVLFADELSTCLPSQQNAMLGLLTHAKFEGIDISPYISIVMAGNPEGTVSTLNEVSEAVINRGGHIAWFGDVNLFLEEWGNGFGSQERVPARKVAWFVKELLNQAPEEAFRNNVNWSVDTLVPYERMEHTERSVTELARMITLINEVMEGLPGFIRQTYIVEVTRALLGNKWAERAALVAAMESEFLSPDFIMSRFDSIDGLSSDTPSEEFNTIMQNANYPLYHLPDNTVIRQDQVTVLMGEMIERVTQYGFSKEAYIASWAFAVSAPTSGQIMSNHSYMLTLLSLAQIAVERRVLEPVNAVPAFVSQDIRDNLRSAAANA